MLPLRMSTSPPQCVSQPWVHIRKPSDEHLKSTDEPQPLGPNVADRICFFSFSFKFAKWFLSAANIGSIICFKLGSCSLLFELSTRSSSWFSAPCFYKYFTCFKIIIPWWVPESQSRLEANLGLEKRQASKSSRQASLLCQSCFPSLTCAISYLGLQGNTLNQGCSLVKISTQFLVRVDSWGSPPGCCLRNSGLGKVRLPSSFLEVVLRI